MASFTLSLEELQHELQHIHENRGSIVIGVASMLLVLCFTVTAARFFARWITRAPFAVDDYLVLIALVRKPLNWVPKGSEILLIR